MTEAEAADLLPPRSGFSAWYRVRYNEMDVLGHVHNATYLHYLEETAIQHSAALNYRPEDFTALGGLFIARRHEIDYLRAAIAGDLLQVVTWVGEMGGARALRDYCIIRRDAANNQVPADSLVAAGAVPPGELIVRGRTLWVWVDTTHHRPRRIPAQVCADFQTGQPRQPA